MSPSSELVPSAKRQRPVDAVQDLSRVDADNRSKRLKTRQDGQPKKGKKIGNSSTGQIAVQKTPKWSLDVVSRGQVYNTEPVFSVDEKYVPIARLMPCGYKS
jgi:NET1-associated nuclear protein 1 (U3 small nucleolar RNA-associated protein 17)